MIVEQSTTWDADKIERERRHLPIATGDTLFEVDAGAAVLGWSVNPGSAEVGIPSVSRSGAS